MGLDLTARRNLELTETLRDKTKKGHYYGFWIRLKLQWERDYLKHI